MENRYLFRGKRTDNGEWVEGMPFEIEGKTMMLIRDDENLLRTHYLDENMWTAEIYCVEVDPATICKCTGLKDKNGTLIWEKDIVSFEHKKIEDVLSWDFAKYIRNYVIEFKSTFVKYGLRFRNKSIHFECKQSTLCTHNCEVIGNEIDNPELLGGGKE